MATKVVLSKKFTLQWRDALRGLVMAGLTSALVVIQQSIESGMVTFKWQQVTMAAVGGGVGYLLKNWLLEPAKVITSIQGTDAKAEQVSKDIKQAL